MFSVVPGKFQTMIDITLQPELYFIHTMLTTRLRPDNYYILVTHDKELSICLFWSFGSKIFPRFPEKRH